MATIQAPAPRTPVPVSAVPTLRGESVVLVNEDGPHYGWVAWSEVTEMDGHPMVEVVPERSWWSSELLGARPAKVLAWPAGCVFVL